MDSSVIDLFGVFRDLYGLKVVPSLEKRGGGDLLNLSSSEALFIKSLLTSLFQREE